MTTDLKELMTEAVDAQAPYAVDLDGLLRTGHRQVRRRRVIGTAAALAAIAVVTAGAAVAFDTANTDAPVAPVPAPAPFAVPPGGSIGKCQDADGRNAPGFLWTKVVVYTQDTFGMTMVRQSPTNPHVVAYCTTEWDEGAKDPVVPGGAKDGVVLRKGVAVGRGAAPGSSVTSVFGVVPKGTPPRVTVETADGHVGVATVKGGYFVYRRVEHSPWPGPAPRAIVRFKYPGKAEYVAASR